MRNFFLISLLFLTSCSEKDQQMIWAAIQTLGEQNQTIAQPKTANSQNYESVAYKVSQAIEPTNSTVRTYAVKLAAQYPGEYSVAQICAIWYDVKDRWRYVSDPHGQDYFASASETIKIGLAGDCDDFAILMASLIEAIGGSSRVILTLGAEQGDHAYCEVYLGKSPEKRDIVVREMELYIAVGYFKTRKIDYGFYGHKDESGYWLNLDWSADHPGGPLYKSPKVIKIYSDGRSEIQKVK